MNTLKDHDAVIAAWLDEGAMTMPSETRQAIVVGSRTVARRQARMGWRFGVNRLAQVGVGAAATLLVVAVVGYQFLPGGFGSGGTLLARGSFVLRDWGNVEVEATTRGSSVAGSLTVSRDQSEGVWPLTVDLKCTRTTEDGLIMIGGKVTDRHGSELWPEGTAAAIVLTRESPVQAQIWVGALANSPATQTTDCLAYLDAWLTWERHWPPNVDWLFPIDGTVELGP